MLGQRPQSEDEQPKRDSGESFNVPDNLRASLISENISLGLGFPFPVNSLHGTIIVRNVLPIIHCSGINL